MKINKEIITKFTKDNLTNIAIGITLVTLTGMVLTENTTREELRLTKESLESNTKIISTLEDDLKEKETEVAKLEGIVLSLEENNLSLQGKVDSAKPYFDMEESKQLELAEQVAKEEEERLAREEEERLAKLQAELDSKTVELSNGNFVAGVDFESGTYDIVAVKGTGNVSSDNMFNGGLNAIMGVSSNEMYAKEYKNIRLPSGTSLKISGVTVRLVPKN